MQFDPPPSQRPPGASRQNRVAELATALLIVVLAFGAGIGVGRATAPGGLGTAGSLAAPGATAVGSQPGSATSWLAGLPADGPLLGRADVKVVITYWADYQCPFCARFAALTLPQLASRIADGTVAVRHRDYAILGDESFDAAVAVRCAGEQGKFWLMHDAVYAAQAGENQGAFAAPKLAAIAANIGADPGAFAACTARHDVFVGVLEDSAAGVRAGVASTPTLDAGGHRFVGVTDVSTFIAAIDAAAAAAAAGATPAPIPAPSPSGDPWASTPTTGLDAGAATSPVTVQLWMDYQAVGSPVIANNLEPELRTRIASGRIRVELHDLALDGAESVAAGVMVRCTANQNGPTWFVHDVLAVSAQGPGQGIYVTRNLLRLGARLGLQIATLDTCLADPSVASQVTAETAQGQAAQLAAGPAVVIKIGSREVARFSGTVDVAKVLAAVDAAK